MTKVLNLVSYSGGKDSGALALWLQEKGVPNLRLVFCDTKWEYSDTYKYIFEFSAASGIPLVVLDSIGMHELVTRKGRMPAVKARFCTEELKLKVFKEYVETLHRDGYDTVVWIGTRAEESRARALHPMSEWSRVYDCRVCRPIKWLTTKRILGLHRKHGVPLNPLYKQGMTRVGCRLCIMARKGDVAQVAKRFPDVFDELARWEKEVNSTWFRAGDVPKKFCSLELEVVRKKYATDEYGKVVLDSKGSRLAIGTERVRVSVPTALDAMRWALDGDAPGGAEATREIPQCESRYNLCE